MPKTNVYKYTAEEIERHNAAYNRLWKIIGSAAPDAEEFRRALDKELASGFPIDFYGPGGWTLLHYAVNMKERIKAGLPQVLIDASADVNIRTKDGETPLGIACWWYVRDGEPEYLTAIDVLLAGRQGAGRQDAAGTRNALKESLNAPTGQGRPVAGTRNALRESLSAPTGRGRSVAGARPELDESWKKGWTEPEQRARRDWLNAYINTWHERRAKDRAEDAAPGFDYAL